jgi:flagellar hook-basal body complex protein FliE
MDDMRIKHQQQFNLQPDKNIGKAGSSEFGKVIKETIERVNRLDQEADRSIMDLLKGKTDIHESMIALQKMDISMRLLLTVRNKAVEAYKEIMHLQF